MLNLVREETPDEERSKDLGNSSHTEELNLYLLFRHLWEPIIRREDEVNNLTVAAPLENVSPLKEIIVQVLDFEATFPLHQSLVDGCLLCHNRCQLTFSHDDNDVRQSWNSFF